MAPPANDGSQKKLARRVSFNESTIIQTHNYDTESQIEEHIKEDNDHKRHICCNYCCAWTSLIIGSIVLVLLVVTIIFFSVFQSNMPDFVVTRLDVSKLDVNSTGSDSFLNADVIVVMNVTNKNSNVELYYSSLKVDTKLDDVHMGSTHLPDFQQKPGVSTELKPETVVNNVAVAEADGKSLTDDIINREMVMNVDIEGVIHYFINGNNYKMERFPFRVMCHGIVLNQLDMKQPDKCLVKLTPVR